MVYQRRPRLCVVFLLVETWDAWWNAPCSTPAMVCHSIEGLQARDQLMCQLFNPVRSGRCHGLPKGSKWTNKRVEFHVQPPLRLFHSKVWSGKKCSGNPQFIGAVPTWSLLAGLSWLSQRCFRNGFNAKPSEFYIMPLLIHRGWVKTF